MSEPSACSGIGIALCRCQDCNGGVDRARFRAPVFPGDVLRLEMTVKKLRGPVSVVRGEATVDGKLVADADIKSMMVDA